MSNIDYIINYIMRFIPREILDFIFLPRYNHSQFPPSLEYCIKEKIIDKWVLPDCNIVAGQELVIDGITLSPLYMQVGIIYKIPFELTGGRRITTVMSINYYYNDNMMQGNIVANAATGPSNYAENKIQLVGPNTIYIDGRITLPIRFIRCMVENDNDFRSIDPRALDKLAELCLLATKSYIYTNGIINMDKTMIVGGIPLASFATVIESYSDASTMYKEYLTKKWRKVGIMQDRPQMLRLLQAIVPR